MDSSQSEGEEVSEAKQRSGLLSELLMSLIVVSHFVLLHLKLLSKGHNLLLPRSRCGGGGRGAGSSKGGGRGYSHQGFQSSEDAGGSGGNLI